MMEIGMINDIIAQEEQKINDIYFQIGKIYAENHSEDYEAIFQAQMTEIKAAKAKIEECRQQILEIKGIIKCKACGEELDKNAVFCSSCGTPTKQHNTDNEDSVKCARCGSVIKEGMKFCTLCGTPVSYNASEPAAVPVMTIEPVQQAEEPVVSYEDSIPIQYENMEPVQYEDPLAVPYDDLMPIQYDELMTQTYDSTLSLQYEEPVPVQYEEPAPIQYEAPAYRFCTNCGTKVTADCVFCTECGTRI